MKMMVALQAHLDGIQGFERQVFNTATTTTK